jgi:hypothetical protein
VHKAFVCVQLFHESRERHREDALREAALAITEYAGKGPCTAYSLGKKRTISWVVRQLWQGRHQTPKDKREGKRAIPPTPFSLDAQDWEMVRGGDVGYTRSPEEVLLASEEMAARERCIERFYDVAYDVVANRMGLERRRHYTAENDAEVFQLTLRGYNLTGVAAALDCSTDMASQRVNYARRRLAAFVEERGVEEIAGWYAGMGRSQGGVTDVRAQQAYVAQYVAERQAAYGAEPARRQKEEWKSRARAKWVRLEREGVTTGQEMGEVEEGEARRGRVAVAAD